jgi:hypothetical protein
MADVNIGNLAQDTGEFSAQNIDWKSISLTHVEYPKGMQIKLPQGHA